MRTRSRGLIGTSLDGWGGLVVAQQRAVERDACARSDCSLGSVIDRCKRSYSTSTTFEGGLLTTRIDTLGDELRQSAYGVLMGVYGSTQSKR
jgi:hypothetical protein